MFKIFLLLALHCVAGLPTKLKLNCDSSFSAAALKSLWISYKENHSTETRNLLVKAYLPLVRYQAECIHARLPPMMDLDDLLSEGFLGLLQAIEAFDLDRNIKFETYSSLRIRGAILDWLRHEDFAPAAARAANSKIKETRLRCERDLGRRATDDDVRAALGLSADEFYKLDRKAQLARRPTIAELDEYWGPQSGKGAEWVPDPREPAPENSVADLRRFELLTQTLPSRETAIIKMYYWEGLKFREIGLRLNLSESGVRGIHADSIKTLKERRSQLLKQLGID